MPDDRTPDWRVLIRQADKSCPPQTVIDTGHGLAGNGSSQPQKMSGPGDKRYAVKFPNNPQSLRVLFNEQVCGRLAARIGVACPGVSVVDVSPEAAEGVDIGGNPGQPGAAHGSVWLDDVDPVGLDIAVALGDNRRRYTGLMVFFTIIGNVDSQFVYGTSTPHDLYSVDHGHTFTSENWTTATLDSAAEPVEISTHGAHGLDDAALRELHEALSSLTPDDLAAILHCIPGSWGVSMEERCAAARFLWRRISATQALIEKELART